MEHDLLRPSKLGEWATCAKKMRYLSANEGGGRGPHISTWIGTAVHARMAGKDVEPIPAGVLYDKTTPNHGIAELQIGRIVGQINELFWIHGLTPLAWEVPVSDGEHEGTLDVVLAKEGFCSRSMIGDIKTGKHVPNGVWLQLGSYFSMDSDLDLIPHDVIEVCVIHVPRLPTTHPQSGSITTRNGEECAREAALWYRMIERLLDDDGDINDFPASPGMSCHSCPMTVEECAVRIEKE